MYRPMITRDNLLSASGNNAITPLREDIEHILRSGNDNSQTVVP
jgi:hypothetical protein